MPSYLQAFGLSLPIVKKSDDITELIVSAAKKQNIGIENNDIIIITEKIVSKSEGRIISLKNIKPSHKAIKLAKEAEKDPRLVEAILRESKDVLKVEKGFIIVETRHGFICANAGIDASNIAGNDETIKLLPKDPDKSAEKIRKKIEKAAGKKIGVIISDSFGRPFRFGSVGVAIGASNVKALWDRRGEKDLFGKVLKTTRVSLGDALASLGNLVTGEAGEGIPVVVVKTNLGLVGKGRAKELIRDKKTDVFR